MDTRYRARAPFQLQLDRPPRTKSGPSAELSHGGQARWSRASSCRRSGSGARSCSCKSWPSGHWYFTLRDRQTPGALRHVAHLRPAGGRRRPKDGHRGASSSARPGSTRPRASSSSASPGCCPTAASRRRAAGARAGQGGAARGTASSTPPASGRCRELASHRRGRHQPRRRGAARHRHRGAAAAGPRRLVVVGRAGAGRRRGARPGARARAGEPAPGRRRSASSAGAAARGRIWRRSTPRRSAAPSPRCRCPPSPRSATRPTSRSPTSSPTCAPPRHRPRRSWRSPTGARCCRQLDDLGARLAGGLGAPHPARARAAGPHRRPARSRRWSGAVRRERHRLERLAAQLDALSPLRVLDRGYAVPLDAGRPGARAAADFTPGAPFHGCGCADGDVPPRGWSPDADTPSPTIWPALEEIVRRLEADDVDLDAALALFEEGVARLRAAREPAGGRRGEGAAGARRGRRRPPAHRSRWLRPPAAPATRPARRGARADRPPAGRAGPTGCAA